MEYMCVNESKDCRISQLQVVEVVKVDEFK